MKRIYISGKISGIEELAPILFERAEYLIKAMGSIPVNPMTLNHEHDKSWTSYMKEDVKALCDCDAIYMLDNWKESRGAVIEHYIAEQLDLEIIYHKELETV